MSEAGITGAESAGYVTRKTFALVVIIETAAFAAIIAGLAIWLGAGRMPNAPATTTLAAAPAAQKPLLMATCSGSLDETSGDDFWVIPLKTCDAALDHMDVKGAFLSNLDVCGGAKSFRITTDPRTVTGTSDAIHCSSTKTQATVTYLGYAKD